MFLLTTRLHKHYGDRTTSSPPCAGSVSRPPIAASFRAQVGPSKKNTRANISLS